MKINIVCYEDPETWICGKIARRLTEALTKLGHTCQLGRAVDDAADINHHVIYLSYPGHRTGCHTLMVTHVDEAIKLRKLAAAMTTAKAAICMSAESASRLVQLGLPVARLAHVSPAHDQWEEERKFVVGLTTRLYPDGRKRESDLARLASQLSPRDFSFKIMGFGWADIVADLRRAGFAVDYWPDFHDETYRSLIASLDYYLYLSGDEGSMGFVDALAAGVKTIVQPQGFHRDAPGGITHPFTHFDELASIFAAIAAEKHARQDAVRNWSWEGYARSHLTIWKACLAGQPLGAAAPVASGGGAAWRLHARLWWNALASRFRLVSNVRRDFACESKLWRRPGRSDAPPGTEAPR